MDEGAVIREGVHRTLWIEDDGQLWMTVLKHQAHPTRRGLPVVVSPEQQTRPETTTEEEGKVTRLEGTPISPHGPEGYPAGV